jgi:hypothetical protein
MLTESLRLVQVTHPRHGRKVAQVQEPDLLLLRDTRSVYDLALEAIHTGQQLHELVAARVRGEKIPYDEVYKGASSWRLLPCFDHPDSPMSCLVAGTGLTHKNSALNRQMMHQAEADKPTDSMQMYRWGLEAGQPAPGQVGVQPEWFYKGTGVVLRAHGEALEVPPYADDGGEEPEVAGLYVVDQEGQPWRVGFCTGNEFSDHVMEKKNYLYLAPSKLRTCAIGPELVVDMDFQEIAGRVSVFRKEQTFWSKETKTGEQNMAHSLANLEHHHFKYAGHRVPFQAHVHFFGADAFSFGEQVQLQEGDVMEVAWEGLGRALQNTLHVAEGPDQLVQVKGIK